MSVAIVGAGPGDPGLITVRGLELVEAAEVLVYDRLVSPELVARAAGGRVDRPRRADATTGQRGARPAGRARARGRPPQRRRSVRLRPRRGGGRRARRRRGRVRGRARSVDADRAPGARGDPAHAPRHLGSGDVVTGTAGDGRRARLRAACRDARHAGHLHGAPASRADRRPADPRTAGRSTSRPPSSRSSRCRIRRSSSPPSARSQRRRRTSSRRRLSSSAPSRRSSSSLVTGPNE